MARRWVCSVCHYLYDPAVGDPSGGVAPGTPFDALPKDWCCPDCGAGTIRFEGIADGSHAV